MAWLLENWQGVLLALQAVLGAGVALALLVPGEQPEKALKWLADLLSKVSNK